MQGKGEMMERLSDEEIAAALSELDGWTREGEEMRKTFRFHDFIGSVNFVNAVAEVAEAARHHPDIDIRFNKVTVALSTHSVGGITARDADLARAIEHGAR